MLPAIAITTDIPSENGILNRVEVYARKKYGPGVFRLMCVRQGHIFNVYLRKEFLARLKDTLSHKEPVLLFPPESLSYEYFARTFFEELCSGITGPVFNNIANCGKFLRRNDCLRKLKEGGFRVPEVYDVKAKASELKTRYPAIIRAVDGHGGTGKLRLAGGAEDLHAYDNRPRQVMAVEFVDTARQDGTYWKYRTVVVGNKAIPRQLQISKAWEVRLGTSAKNSTERDEALKVLASGDPFEKELVSAVRCLGLDMACVDYSILDGRPVIWEIFLPFAVTKQYPTYEEKLYEEIIRFVRGVEDGQPVI
jgi:hypothetical protein